MCGAEFIPFEPFSKCPVCGFECGTTFDIVDESLQARDKFKESYPSGVPPAYEIQSLGDIYIYRACWFLAEYEESRFEGSPSEFVERMRAKRDFHREKGLADHIAEFYRRLLMRFVEERDKEAE